MKLTLPTQYDFLDRFFRLAIINVLSNITVPLSGLISVAFLGHLNQLDYLAGVALSTPLFGYIYSTFSFLRMTTTGLTAQAVGRDDQQGMLLVGLRNGLIALGIGVVILILQYPLQLLSFTLMSATPEVKASGIAYFNTRIWGAPAVLLNYVLIGWFLGREMSGKVLLLTLVGNAANIMLDYLLIIHWDWTSAGAGLAQAASQYLMLLLGVILVSREIQWQEVGKSVGKFWNLSEFKAALTLNGNIFVRALATTLTSGVFINLSAVMGTIILAENALLLQVALLSIFVVEGVGFATQTLTGNLSGKEANEQLLLLVQVAVGTSLLMGIGSAGACVLFPETIFGLLTDKSEIIQQIKAYVPWLLLIQVFYSVSLILDGYFAGLGQGYALRNAALAGVLVGFMPIAGAAWYFQNNHLLLLALALFMATKAVVLAFLVPGTLKNEPAVIASKLFN